MPLSNTFEARRLAKRMHRLRENPFKAYGIAVAAVAIATLIRWAIGGYVLEGIPFTAYLPAIIIATLLGGFWPGVLATTVSGLVAWFLFLPPAFEFALTWPQGATILAFVLISLLLVGLVTGLNSIVNRFLILEQNLEAEIERCRYAERDARRLAAIVESSDDAIVAKDLNGIVTSWNQGAERLFGYTADEMVDKPISILIPPDRHNEEPSILERLRRGQRIDHYETVRQHKDGSLIDISLTVSPVTDAEGTVIGASKIARDIRERKRAAEQQNMLIREMGHRVKNAFAVMSGVVAMSARSAATPEAMARGIQARLAALTRAHDLTRPGLLDFGIMAWAVDDFSRTGTRDFCSLSRLGGVDGARTPDRQRTRRADRRKVSDGPRPAAARTRNECGQVWLPVIRKRLRPHRLVYVEWPISRYMGGGGRTPA